MTDEKKIRLEIEITEREAALLTRWPIPAEHCGSSLESRIRFLIDDMCLGLEGQERSEKSKQLHRLFNLRSPDESSDDFIPF